MRQKDAHELRPGFPDEFPGGLHDHSSCVDAALGRAASLCNRRGVRLTALRRRVLELVWQSHAPAGAYELLERLGVERGRVAPPTVYRALDFLAEQGLVHRLDTLNAFVGCDRPLEGHKAYFLICLRCRNAAEFHDNGLDGAIADVARGIGFSVASETVEISGLCGACAGSEAAGPTGPVRHAPNAEPGCPPGA